MTTNCIKFTSADIETAKGVGSISTLTFDLDITVEPVASSNPMAPTHRVLGRSPRGKLVECGGIWKKQNKETGADYYTLTIRDHGFNANLGKAANQDDLSLQDVIPCGAEGRRLNLQPDRFGGPGRTRFRLFARVQNHLGGSGCRPHFRSVQPILCAGNPVGVQYLYISSKTVLFTTRSDSVRESKRERCNGRQYRTVPSRARAGPWPDHGFGQQGVDDA